MQASHIDAQSGSLLLILGTTMQFGYGRVQSVLCTGRAHCRMARNMPPLWLSGHLCHLTGQLNLLP